MIDLCVICFRMSHSRGDFGYGSTSHTEFGDHRPVVADPRGDCCSVLSCNELCLLPVSLLRRMLSNDVNVAKVD